MSDNPTPRIAVPKSVRFEVFKRDKFTCQYCGRKAPEVVLNCDHIVPVAECGGNEILNLITSCFDCNSGKGARQLDDSAAIDRQVGMLVELEERRQQIEMMIRWRQELSTLDEVAVTAIVERIKTHGGWGVNETGLSQIRRWLKRFNVDELLQAVDESFGIHLRYVDDIADEDSWNKAFNKIPSTADRLIQEREKPYIGRLLYIQGIIRHRIRNKGYKCFDYLEHVHLHGLSLDEMERRAKRMNALEDFEGPIDAWLDEIGAPF